MLYPRIYFHMMLRHNEHNIASFIKSSKFHKIKSKYICTASMSAQKHSVLVTRGDVPQVALDKLRESCDVEVYPEASPIPRDILLKRIERKNGLFCLLTDKIDKEVLDAAGENLKVIGTMSVGFDHLSLDDIKARRIKVGYTPGILTNATADLTVALLLATSRRLFDAHKELLSGGWGSWSPLWMTGWSLSGSTVGIFGFGRIGLAVVKRLQGFGVGKFIYNSRSEKKEAGEVSASFVSFHELLRDSDFLILTAALNEETKEIFNKDAFSKMKKNAVLINTARGGLIDQDALIDALKSGQIQAAGLDVMTPEPLPTDHPLINTPNLTLIPHIGSADVPTRVGMAMLTANNIIAGLNGDEMPEKLV